MSAGPDYGSSIFAAWREAAGDEWHSYTRHAFVEGMREGSLPREAFLHYLVQDYVFLVHFSRAWALAVVKSGSVDEMRAAAATVDALVNREMPLHVATCAKVGLLERDLYEAAEAPENLAYTRYVLDAGVSGDFLDLMAALAPCVMGYGEIGARLGREKTAETYGEWIATYAGHEYQEVCASVGALIERAAATRLGADPAASPRWDALCQRFRTATRLEIGFWDMGLRGHP